jgi:heat shock protein HslJ
MESTSTSKIAMNVLIVSAILLISASLVTVLTKKPEIAEVKTTTPEPQTNTNEQNIATTTGSYIPATSDTLISSTEVATTSFVGKHLKLTEILTKENKTITLKKAKDFTVTFVSDGSVTGTTDCNNFFGTYKATGTKITLSPLGSSKMFCEGSQEGEFLSYFQGITSYISATNSDITFISASGSLMFKQKKDTN